jgi:hypothetical protein
MVGPTNVDKPILVAAGLGILLWQLTRVSTGAETTFWSMAGIVSVALLVVGVMAMVAGYLAHRATDTDTPATHMRQRGGTGSTNLQAGGNIVYKSPDRDQSER